MTNWIASFAEDVAALIAIWMILRHPLAMLCFVLLFVIVAAWMAPKVWRGLQLRRSVGWADCGRDGGGEPRPRGRGEVTLEGVQGG